MYQAREEIMKILKIVEKRELMRVSTNEKNFGDLLVISSRLLKKI